MQPGQLVGARQAPLLALEQLGQSGNRRQALREAFLQHQAAAGQHDHPGHESQEEDDQTGAKHEAGLGEEFPRNARQEDGRSAQEGTTAVPGTVQAVTEDLRDRLVRCAARLVQPEAQHRTVVPDLEDVARGEYQVIRGFAVDPYRGAGLHLEYVRESASAQYRVPPGDGGVFGIPCHTDLGVCACADAKDIPVQVLGGAAARAREMDHDGNRRRRRRGEDLRRGVR